MDLLSSPPPIKRCAIYTRKSTNRYLEREVNSIEGQREVCSAYILSQQHRGWIEVSTRYDDGGYPGTDPDRPALAALMKDIEAGLVDTVVIYKIDRLTRSLSDFVRLVDIFDRYNTCFVSVTQAFDTSDSLGRMILNILLTFSQFERELISDRIRDSVRQRKRHGQWPGGMAPFGYRERRGKLVIDQREAEMVRQIFAWFVELGTYAAVKRKVVEAGFYSEAKTTKSKRKREARALSNGHVYAILRNPIYVGELRGDGERFRGNHEAIIEPAVWNSAVEIAAGRLKGVPRHTATGHFLGGILWDCFGRRMLLAVEIDKGKDYRYYISSAAQWASRTGVKPFRSQARKLDELAVVCVRGFLSNREQLRGALKQLGLSGEELVSLTRRGEEASFRLGTLSNSELEHVFNALCIRIEIKRQRLTFTFRSSELKRFLEWSGASPYYGRSREWHWSDAKYELSVPVVAATAGRSNVIDVKAQATDSPQSADPKLVDLILKARAARELMETRRDLSLAELARKFDCRPAHFSRLLHLNYLAPDIALAILDGTQPTTLTRSALFEAQLPFDWALQRELLGFTNRPQMNEGSGEQELGLDRRKGREVGLGA